MDMYAIELGRSGPDGFELIEAPNMLASDREGAEKRAIEILRTRGAQIGAKRLRLLAGGQTLVWEYP